MSPTSSPLEGHRSSSFETMTPKFRADSTCVARRARASPTRNVICPRAGAVGVRVEDELGADEGADPTSQRGIDAELVDVVELVGQFGRPHRPGVLGQCGPGGESMCGSGDLFQGGASFLGVAGVCQPAILVARRRRSGARPAVAIAVSAARITPWGPRAIQVEAREPCFQEPFVAAFEGADSDFERVRSEGGQVEAEVSVVGSGVSGECPAGNRSEHSCDDLLFPSERFLTWWTENRETVHEAVAATP